MKKQLPILLAILWSCMAGLHAEEAACSATNATIILARNAEYLQKAQHAATTCKSVQLHVEDYEENEDYRVELTKGELGELRGLIARLQPCQTDTEVDIDPSRYIMLCFIDADGKCIFELDEIDVAEMETPPPANGYPLAHFVLTKADYAQWRRLISRIEKRN